MPIPINIEEQLSAIRRGDAPAWGQVAALLDEVNSGGYWGSSSFTEWMSKNAPIFGIKQATLWRYFTSGRYLMQLRERTESLRALIPTLDLLPNSVSPESVELLSKLERVVSEAEFEILLKRTLVGDVRRVELRSLWETYRPVLEGKTARGRGVDVPRINREDPGQCGSLMEANFLSAIKSADSSWTGVINPERYKVFLHVVPEGPPVGESKYMFPAVAVVKPKDAAVVFHAVIYSPLLGRLWKFVEDQRVFADYLWVIPLSSLHGMSMGDIHQNIPSGIGLLNIENGALQVSVPAKPVPEPGSRRVDLASALLVRLMKSKG